MNMEARIRGIGMTSLRTRSRLIGRLRDNGIADQRVLDALSQVPRHMFVDEALASRAYEDCALPIGEGQTISQPYVVALMTELVLQAIDQSALKDQEVSGRARVLEIGTGSGYQAAVLARLVDKVYSLERVRSLAHSASRRLQELKYRNVNVRYADGFDGWAGESPFDVIVVTAAMEEVPESLLAQIAPDGVMIGPIGPHDGAQTLASWHCPADGEPVVTSIAPVRFVPFLSGLS